MSGEGVQALAAHGLRTPKTLTLAVTGRCNLRCSHCWVEAAPDREGEGPVPVRAAVGLVEAFLACGGNQVCLTGGELLTHPQWRSLVARCARRVGPARLRLQTNATLIGPEEARFLAALGPGGPAVQVSVDGAGPATHDRVRGRGSFSRAVRGLGWLAAAGLGPHTELLFTEMRHNLDELPQLLGLAERLGVARVRSASVVPGGRAARRGRIEPPTAAQYAALRRRHETDGVFRRRCARYGAPVAVAWLGGGPRPPHECTFVENPYVTAGGAVYPCVLFHSPAHAVFGAFERPWEELLDGGAPLWGALRAASRQRSAALPACAGCPVQPACRGGCMGRAQAAHGDPMTVEDRCALRRAVVSPPCREGPP
ncbi:MAG: radical SAM protein [Deferrisomatales bacterium]